RTNTTLPRRLLSTALRTAWCNCASVVTSASSGGEQIAVGDDRVPGPQLPADEDTVLVEGVALEQLLRVLAACGFVDDAGAGVVGNRPRGGKLPVGLQRREVLPMHRPYFLNLFFILNVFDDADKLHGSELRGERDRYHPARASEAGTGRK